MDAEFNGYSDLALEEKRAALEFALQSEVLSHSERLKSFLSYICNAEFEGKHERLTEYDIAVSALGRRKDFSPTEDSAVRGRAYELRQKLDMLYKVKAPDYPIRISLQKGSYRPRFDRAPQSSAGQAQGTILWAPVRRLRWTMRTVGIGSFALGVIATLVIVNVFLGHSGTAASPVRISENRPWTPELRELWAPFLKSSRPLLITFETRLFVMMGQEIVVRDPTVESFQKIETSSAIMGIKHLLKAPEVYEARRYSDFGVVNCVFSLTNLLSTTGLPLQAQRAADMSDQDIHADNLILVGKPGAYDSVKGMSTPTMNFVVGRDGSIRNLHPKTGEPAVFQKSFDAPDTGGFLQEYALITMTPGLENGQHILSLICAESELFWPLGQYLTDPSSAKDLVNHLRLPSGKFPDAYEVVIGIQERNQRPIRISYVAHRVIPTTD